MAHLTRLLAESLEGVGVDRTRAIDSYSSDTHEGSNVKQFRLAKEEIDPLHCVG